MEVPISVVSVVANAGGEDDREPFLSASGGGSGPSAATSSAARRWCSLRAVGRSLRRLPRPRSVLARAAATVDVRGLGRGLVLCGALLLVGVVGSFALRQMVSPEIDSLVRDRQRLQQSLELLKMQVCHRLSDHSDDDGDGHAAVADNDAAVSDADADSIGR